MGTKIKRQDETVQEVNPHAGVLELFDGLINLAFVCSSSQSGNSRRLQLNLKDVLCFELWPFPASIFESEVLMLKANRSQLTDSFKKLYEPQAVNSAMPLWGMYYCISLLGGGSLFYTITWTKRSTFGAVEYSYMWAMRRNIIYPITILWNLCSTKDSTHIHSCRGKSKSTNISIAPRPRPKHSRGFIKEPISIKSAKQTIICRFRGITCVQDSDEWWCRYTDCENYKFQFII